MLATGTLWKMESDNLKKEIIAAGKTFFNKTGKLPTVCLVHPDLLSKRRRLKLRSTTILITPVKNIGYPNYILVGVPENENFTKE